MDRQKIRTIAVWVLALGLVYIFGTSGGTKLYAPAIAGIQQVQAGVPSALGLPFAVVLGSIELFTALLLLIPGYRRVGAALAGLMLIVFMSYMGLRYTALKGVECGCSIAGHSRTLGVGFFIEDGLMLAAAVAIFLLARRSETTQRRTFLRPALALMAILLMGFGSASLERPLFAHESALSLRIMDREGRIAEMPISGRSRTLLYFFDPACPTCQKASELLAKYQLKAPLIVLPDMNVEGGYDYLKQAGVKNALVSLDHQPLAAKWGLKKVPTMYVLRGATPQDVILDFDPAPLDKKLRQLDLVQ